MHWLWLSCHHECQRLAALLLVVMMVMNANARAYHVSSRVCDVHVFPQGALLACQAAKPPCLHDMQACGKVELHDTARWQWRYAERQIPHH